MKNFYARLTGCCLPGSAEPSWSDQTRDYSLTTEIHEAWLVGHPSGIAAGSGPDIHAGADNEAVFLMADDYCIDNARTNLASSGTSVVRQLMQPKGIVHMPALP